MSTIDRSILSKIAQSSRDLSIFNNPTPDQRAVKARFWAAIGSAGVRVPPTIDLAMAAKYGSDSRVSNWWKVAGFPEWFSNSSEFKDRVEFLAHMALDSVEDILRDRTANATAKINAVKIIMEIGGKFPQKQTEERYADEKIAAMGKEELEKYINSRLHLVSEVK